MVKLEGAGHKLEVIRHLVEREIPVCAHLGLTPQSVLRVGGFKVQGRGDSAAENESVHPGVLRAGHPSRASAAGSYPAQSAGERSCDHRLLPGVHVPQLGANHRQVAQPAGKGAIAQIVVDDKGGAARPQDFHGAQVQNYEVPADLAESNSRRSSTPSQNGFTGCQSMSGREPVRKKVGLNTMVPGARYWSRTVPL